MCVCICVCLSHSVMFNSLQPHELDKLEPARLLYQWDSPGKNSGGVCHSLLQRIFLTHGSNPGLPHCRQMLYCLTRVQMQALPPIDFKKLLSTLSLGCLVHKRGNIISISQYLPTLSRVLNEIIYVKCPE